MSQVHFLRVPKIINFFNPTRFKLMVDRVGPQILIHFASKNITRRKKEEKCI